MTRRDADNFIDDLCHELQYIKEYRKQIGHPEKHLKSEARRIGKLMTDIRKAISILRVVRRQYE